MLKMIHLTTIIDEKEKYRRCSEEKNANNKEFAKKINKTIKTIERYIIEMRKTGDLYFV